ALLKEIVLLRVWQTENPRLSPFGRVFVLRKIGDLPKRIDHCLARKIHHYAAAGNGMTGDRAQRVANSMFWQIHAHALPYEKRSDGTLVPRRVQHIGKRVSFEVDLGEPYMVG